VKSSTIVNILNLLPSARQSCMKSIDHRSFGLLATGNGAVRTRDLIFLRFLPTFKSSSV
jgi:hypothetical protein